MFWHGSKVGGEEETEGWREGEEVDHLIGLRTLESACEEGGHYNHINMLRYTLESTCGDQHLCTTHTYART